MKTFILKKNDKRYKLQCSSLTEAISICKKFNENWVLYSKNYKRLAYSSEPIFILPQLWNFKY
jgi:hypothetical protein